MTDHISSVCKSASFALYRIGRIRRFLDQTSAEWLIHAFIISRLDFCKSMLYGIDDKQLRRLQSIQNSAARLITRTRKHEHITPVLQSLHWLPIRCRIDFKLNTVRIALAFSSRNLHLFCLRHARNISRRICELPNTSYREDVFRHSRFTEWNS